MGLTKNNLEILDKPFPNTGEQITFSQKNGFIKIKHVFPADVIQYMNETISSEVKRLNTQHLPIEQRDTYGKAFLQIVNLLSKSQRGRQVNASPSLKHGKPRIVKIIAYI